MPAASAGRRVDSETAAGGRKKRYYSQSQKQLVSIPLMGQQSGQLSSATSSSGLSHMSFNMNNAEDLKGGGVQFGSSEIHYKQDAYLQNDGVKCCGGVKLTVDWRFLSGEIVARVALALAALLLYLFKDPFIREVWPTNWDEHAMPYQSDEKFPMGITVVICIFVPLVFLIIGCVLLSQKCRWRKSLVFEECLFFVLAYFLAVLLAVAGCEFVKRMYGQLRPDYLARCFGSNDPADWAALGYPTLLNIPEVPDCSKTTKLTDSEMKDGRMSFPSEHSAITWSVFLFTSLWIYGKLSLFQNTGAFRIVIPFALLLLPTGIAISRTSDYRHFVSDVIGGTIIGIVIAIITYRFYWPISMKPLMADVYCIFESSIAGRNARLREVPHAKLRVDDSAIFNSPDYQTRRQLFFEGKTYLGKSAPKLGTHPAENNMMLAYDHASKNAQRTTTATG